MFDTAPALTHPLAVSSSGADLFLGASWLYPGVTTRHPETSPAVLDALAPHDAELAAALAAHDAAMTDADDAQESGETLAEAYAESIVAWRTAVGTASRPPKMLDLDATAFTLAATWSRMIAALDSTRRLAIAIDTAAQAAAIVHGVTVRDALLASAATAHETAVKAVSAAESAALVLAGTFGTVSAVDALTLKGSGVPVGEIGHLMGDRLPKFATGVSSSSHTIVGDHTFGRESGAANALRASLVPIEVLDALTEVAPSALSAKYAASQRRTARSGASVVLGLGE